MGLRRLHVAGPLAEGEPVALAAGQAHYLRDVMRLGRGDEILVFDGCNGEWLARVEAIAKAGATVVPIRCTRAQRMGPDLWLCFAPVKRGRIDMIVEKATELGAARLLPVMTRYTDVSRVNLDRLAATAVEAAEQCERLDVPELAEPVTLSRLIADWPAGRPLIVCAERSTAATPQALAREVGAGPAGILVGPEGGFAAAELDALAELDFSHFLGLGPRVLRAETAVAAALACWQCLAGDWSERPFSRAPHDER